MESMNTIDPQKGSNIGQIVPLPEEYLRCSRTHLVVIISRMLSFLIQINDANNAGNQTMELTRFHSKAAPSITVYQYLIRLTKYSSLEHSVLLSAVYYIDLLSAVYPEFTLNSLTVHRFLLTATTIASKGLCDSFCTNTHYSKVGGVQCSELNILENEFLERVRYRIIPRDDNIENCKMEQKLCSNMLIPMKNASQRGPNNGFNVLQNYYKKIVQLVGNPLNSPDKTSTYFFKMVDPMNPGIGGTLVPPSTTIKNNIKDKGNGRLNTNIISTTSRIVSQSITEGDSLTLTEHRKTRSRETSVNENRDSPPITIPQKRNLKEDDPTNMDGNSTLLRNGKKLSSHFNS
ncbi:Pho80 [Kluyveromyces lactis]|nr:Pho80 [Kluyveromyces lactis]